MKAIGRGKQTAFIAHVNADYEVAKNEAIMNRHSTAINVRTIERRWKLRPGQLVNFRANLPRKKTPVPDNWP